MLEKWLLGQALPKYFRVAFFFSDQQLISVLWFSCFQKPLQKWLCNHQRIIGYSRADHKTNLVESLYAGTLQTNPNSYHFKFIAMQINFLKLLEYFKEQRQQEVTIETDFSDKEAVLIFTKGHWSKNGNITVCLSFDEMNRILLGNKVREKMQAVNDEFEKIENKTGDDYTARERKHDDILYNTITMYVDQMLNAATGMIVYPEIIPLEIHKANYFRGEIVKR